MSLLEGLSAGQSLENPLLDSLPLVVSMKKGFVSSNGW